MVMAVPLVLVLTVGKAPAGKPVWKGRLAAGPHAPAHIVGKDAANEGIYEITPAAMSALTSAWLRSLGSKAFSMPDLFLFFFFVTTIYSLARDGGSTKTNPLP
jgi:hypothetical protein